LPAATRELLDIDGNQSVEYRHVRLACGDRVLSVAHNWYVPSRLTPEMNRTLEASDTPFGRVVAPLGFTRKRLASRRGAAEDCPMDTVLSHRALLELPDGRPLSLVVECYAAANLP
jgi:chorismate-pyruvate lyase